jgi:hypothetical protein
MHLPMIAQGSAIDLSGIPASTGSAYDNIYDGFSSVSLFLYRHADVLTIGDYSELVKGYWEIKRYYLPGDGPHPTDVLASGTWCTPPGGFKPPSDGTLHQARISYVSGHAIGNGSGVYPSDGTWCDIGPYDAVEFDTTPSCYVFSRQFDLPGERRTTFRLEIRNKSDSVVVATQDFELYTQDT